MFVVLTGKFAEKSIRLRSFAPPRRRRRKAVLKVSLFSLMAVPCDGLVRNVYTTAEFVHSQQTKRQEGRL